MTRGARASSDLGNDGSSVRGGEIPNSRQADHGCEKADHENVKRVGVGVVGHSILPKHEENVVCLPDSLCGICHTANIAKRKGQSAKHRDYRLDLWRVAGAVGMRPYKVI